ncbi:MAG TPA: amino acid adenylation domain-containing protein [Bacteroidales bacterium]|nr:amino acid adenylation domain-containing protein [Bacteroidales bacterium]
MPATGSAVLSFSQSRIWLLEHLNGTRPGHAFPVDLEITGSLDADVLSRAISQLVLRHEALRTVFPLVDGVPVRKIMEQPCSDLEIVHLEELQEDKKTRETAACSKANSEFRFDPEKGPLCRFELLVLGMDQYHLLMNFHELIADPASVKIFLEELASLYRSMTEGKVPDLPVLPYTYSYFTDHQRRWLGSGEGRMQMEYWKKELSGIPAPLQLPAGDRRADKASYGSAELSFEIEGLLLGRIHKLGDRLGTGVPEILLTALGVLMHRYSSQDDLVIGMRIPNREKPELQSMVGNLENILPIRFMARPEMTFTEAVQQAVSKISAATECRDVPFESIVEELKIRRTPDKSPVFQVLFGYRNYSGEGIRIPGLAIEIREKRSGGTPYDLSLEVKDRNDRLSCSLFCRDGLFAEEDLVRMIRHWKNLLDAFSAHEHADIEAVALLSEDEEMKILSEWNRTEAPYPADRCIHDLFEDQVRQYPGSVAAVYEKDSLTYAGLNDRANRLAAYLLERGAGEDRIVAVYLERSLDLLTGLLAVSKTGATYLPLNPLNPKVRIGVILEDAKPSVILTQASLKMLLPETRAQVILVDDPEIYSIGKGQNLSLGNPQKPAYILYTSGSTGKPKGVPVLQHSVVNLVSSIGKLLAVKPDDTLLAVTTIAFDIAELEMFLPLFNGARVVIGSQETAMDMELLMRKLDECHATIFQATPVTFKMLIRSSWKGKPDLKVVSGGEAFSKELARELLSRCKEVWNGYGPTETTIYSVIAKIDKESAAGEGYAPIGRPVDNTKVYVLNRKRVPVPAGHAGELYIGGAGVSPGYLNLPETTAERFLPDPFRKDPGAKMYKTGDLVSFYPDGSLVFLERADAQVKIRGFRIEPGEIESVLSGYDGIKENVVIAVEDPAGEKSLAAYYISQDRKKIHTQELRRYLKQRLPDYMVPAYFIPMNSFPLTASLKVDRKALPDPGSGEAAELNDYTAPSTPTEKELAKIWMSLLRINRIGVHEDFFEAGGYSIIAVTMMTRIEKTFGVRLPLAMLFEQSTIHQIAKLIDNGAESLKWRPLVPIRPSGSRKPLFLVHGMGLNVLLYTTLAKYLDPEVPVYGLQAKGMNGKEKPLETIEEIAAYYISEIMTVDKEGPYAMAGFSLGGRIAYEMAIQLKAMGREVRFLGMFDTDVDEPVAHLPFFRRKLKRARSLTYYIAWNTAHLFRSSEESQLAVIRRRMTGLKKRIAGLDFKIDQETIVSSGAMKELPKYLKKVHRANRRADRKYIVKPYNGKVHVFKAMKQTFYIRDLVNYGWDKYALEGVEVHEVPGEHSTTFAPPNDRVFAGVLQGILDRYEG